MTQQLSRAERLELRAMDIKRTAAGLDDPEATEDALPEAAALRAEADDLHRAEQRRQNTEYEAEVDAIRAARRAARTPGGTA